MQKICFNTKYAIIFQAIGHVIIGKKTIPLYVKNTCAFDSIAQIILTRMFNDVNTVAIVQELCSRNSFFNFIANIYDNQNVTAGDYMERLSILQPLPPFKNRLTVSKGNSGKNYATFDALSNLGGMVPYLLGDTAPSLMFIVEACNNGHAAYPEPAKTLLFSTETLMRAPVVMNLVVTDTIKSFTSEFAMCDCNVEDCDKLRKRNLIYSGKFAIKPYKSLSSQIRLRMDSFELR